MLIRGADLALYRSKEHGGGLHHPYEPQLHVHAEERRVLEIALREALEKNQLHLAYQPVVNVTGAIEGFEALIRWNHPELGSISPRSEEHTSELQSLMRISYAVFCLKKKNIQKPTTNEKT